MLTKSDLEQIKNYLALYGKKDSQLEAVPVNLDYPEVTFEANDYLSVVQDNKNKTIKIKDLEKVFLLTFLTDEDFREALKGKIPEEMLENACVTTEKLADGAVTTIKLGNNAVTTAKIATGAITGDKIANNTIQGSAFAANSITTDKIVDGTITGDKLADGSIQSVDIKDNTLSGSKFVDGSISGSKIQDDVIESKHLLDNSIPASKIKDGSIESVDIKDGTLDGAKIKDNTIESTKLANNAITTDKIIDNSITTGKIANDAVTEDKIVDDSITTNKIANSSVTTDKIVDEAITEDKLANGAVTTAKLADGLISEIQNITDATPTTGSVKPVQSGGVKTAIDNVAFSTNEKVKNVGIDNKPTAESENLVKSGKLYDTFNSLVLSRTVEQGGISGQNGQDTPSNIRIRIKGFLFAPFIITSLSDNYQLYVLKYNLDGTYIISSLWNNKSVIEDVEYKYRVMFKKTDNSDITPSDFSNFKVFSTLEYLVYLKNNTLNITEQTLLETQKTQARNNLGFGEGVFDNEPTFNSNNLVLSGKLYDTFNSGKLLRVVEQGTLDSTDGHATANSTRIRTKSFLYAPINAEILNENYKVRVYTYNLDDTFVDSGTWENLIEKYDRGYKYKLLFRKKDNSDIIPSEIINFKITADLSDFVVKNIQTINTQQQTINTQQQTINTQQQNIINIKESLSGVGLPITLTIENNGISSTNGQNTVASTRIRGVEYIESGIYGTCQSGFMMVFAYKLDGTYIQHYSWSKEIKFDGINEKYRIQFKNESNTNIVSSDFSSLGVKLFEYSNDDKTKEFVSTTEQSLSQQQVNQVYENLGIPQGLWKKRITAVGSSGLDALSGGQNTLTDIQKQTYGVSSDLTMTRVMQILLGYDETNLCAASGNSASSILFKAGLTSYKLKNSFTLLSDKTPVSYAWNLTTIETPMTENLTVLDTSDIGTFRGIINGVVVDVDASSGTITLVDDYDEDIYVPAGSFITRDVRKAALNNNGYLRDGVQNSYGLVLQIGANGEGNTPEEMVNYFDLVIKASNCKWFVCLPANNIGPKQTDGDLNGAIPELLKKYGARFIDHRDYMASLQALIDQGITPTTSALYPDAQGLNSNPLTQNQIDHNVPCDLECIATGKYPSSFWHSAYRDGEAQTINATHFNAQGLECWGKYMTKMVKQFEGLQ